MSFLGIGHNKHLARAEQQSSKAEFLKREKNSSSQSTGSDSCAASTGGTPLSAGGDSCAASTGSLPLSAGGDSCAASTGSAPISGNNSSIAMKNDATKGLSFGNEQDACEYCIEQFDTNHDGKLQRSEMKNMLKELDSIMIGGKSLEFNSVHDVKKFMKTADN